MKRYRSARELLDDIGSILGEVPSRGSAPLERVIGVLIEGRHYPRLGVYLDGPDGRQAAAIAGGKSPSAKPYTVTIKIAGRVLGELSVEGEPQRPLSSKDCVLLKEVAARMARFLTVKGKPVLLKFLQAGCKPAKPLGAAAGSRTRQA